MSQSLRKKSNDHIWSVESFWENRKKSIFFIFSSWEADFSKEFLTKVLIEGTKNVFSKNSSLTSKFCFLQIFLMVLAYSELKGFVNWTKIEKQVRFWNHLMFGAFAASQRAIRLKTPTFLWICISFSPKMCLWDLKNLLNPFPTLRNASRTDYLVYFGQWRQKEDIAFSTW